MAKRFKRVTVCITYSSMFVSQCSPENRTQRDLVISQVGQPALDYRLFKVGHLGVEPRSSCSQSRRAPICTSARIVMSVDLQELNLKP